MEFIARLLVQWVMHALQTALTNYDVNQELIPHHQWQQYVLRVMLAITVRIQASQL